MATKLQIQNWLDEGYNIIQNGKPLKIYGDIWDYIQSLENSDDKILVLREVINWEEEELAHI